MLTQYQQEALDYKSHILLSANAGSGKTFVLAKRFVNILLDDDVQLENLVAITFTDKAAGELNKKIANEIEERIKNESNDNKRKKLESIRRHLVSANISTIHSFCVNVLREFAPEAGIDVNFNPIDQITADELLELSIDESLNNLILDKDYQDKLKYLIRFFGSKKLVAQHLKTAIASRKIVEQHLKDLYSKTENEIANYFNKKFEELFYLLFNEKIEDLINAVRIINNAATEQNENCQIAINVIELLSKYSSSKSIIEKITLIKLIGENVLTTGNNQTIRKTGYLNKNRDDYSKEIETAEELFSELKSFYDIEIDDNLHLALARFGKNFVDIYNYVFEIYSEKKRQRGYLDFEDILLFTQNILKLDDVKLYLQKKYKYIMIDEYQDTNELQYKIFMPILDDLKTGNLFVVGDEKQSIYMFRDAELEIFNRTKEEIKGSQPEGKLLNLPHSFRMAPQIILFTNKLFSELLSNPNSFYNEVEYSELICTKDETEDGTVEFIFADSSSGISEAEMVANKILEITSGENKKVEYRDIGILCRKRDYFEELEKEFIKKKIPYTIVGGKGFYQQQIVFDIYNYLSFLINQNDDAALIGILRSPFYTISDAELYDISLEEGKNFFEKLINKSKQNENYKRIVNQLLVHKDMAVSAELYSLIRQILLDTNYWAVIASKRNSEQELANLNKLITLARSFSKKSFKNLYDFVFALKNSIKAIEDESQAQIIKDEDAVKLLTIHQAKGLEYKAVFIYGSNGYAKDDFVRTKSMNIDKNFGFLVKVPLNDDYYNGYYTPPVTALYNHINYKKNIAEIKRLLYVAVTRAMNYLYISITHKEFKPQRDSFFYFINKGLKLDYSADEVVLKDKVKFMKKEESRYNFYDKDYKMKISFTKEIKHAERFLREEKKEFIKNELLIHKIADRPKKEIISATKISMYNQCPVKYELTYELGYTTIYDMIKKYWNQYEFNLKEDDEIKFYSDVKGRIIHSVLKENAEIDNLEYVIEKVIEEESINEQELKIKLKEKIFEELKKFCSSDEYKFLLSSKSKNEIEIYCEEGEHYLYGIIDKLIFENDKLIIVDYKTDSIRKEEINKRAEEYFIQLKFYAYILSKYFSDYNKFTLKIIFINYPDEFVQREISKEELKLFGKELNEFINKIIEGIFQPNLNHCRKCHFALDGERCIKSIASEL